MGVDGLWKILSSIEEKRSLPEFAITEGFRGPNKRLRIGLDVSIVLWRISNVFHVGHSGGGPHPELRIFFFMLARLQRNAIQVTAVFDGANRPAIKRNKKVSAKPHWLTTKAHELLVAFGFECYTAPGEAEAELAHLNHIGLIDAVLSDDVDTFLFGARCVIRNINVKNDGDDIAIYAMDAIENADNISLTQGGLILIALLRGGDYNTRGLEGFGPSIAHAVARTGLGDSLLTAALTLSSANLISFLAQWRQDLRFHLANDPHRIMGRTYTSLARAVPETFPDPKIVLAYALPITSWSGGNIGHSPASSPLPLDIAKLAGICEAWFEWDDVPQRFQRLLWRGSFIRMLSERNSPAQVQQFLPTFDPSAILEIKRAKTVASLKQYYVKVSTTLLSAAAQIVPKYGSDTTTISAEYRRASEQSEPPATFTSMWIPALVLVYSMPQMVETAEARMALKAQRRRRRQMHPVDGEEVSALTSTDDESDDDDTSIIRDNQSADRQPQPFVESPDSVPSTFNGNNVVLNNSDHAAPAVPVQPKIHSSRHVDHIDLIVGSGNNGSDLAYKRDLTTTSDEVDIDLTEESEEVDIDLTKDGVEVQLFSDIIDLTNDDSD